VQRFFVSTNIFSSYFWGGKIAQNFREFTILVWNIYKWSGALVYYIL